MEAWSNPWPMEDSLGDEIALFGLIEYSLFLVVYLPLLY